MSQTMLMLIDIFSGMAIVFYIDFTINHLNIIMNIKHKLHLTLSQSILYAN